MSVFLLSLLVNTPTLLLLRCHATVTLDLQSSNMDLKGTLRAFVLRLSLLGMQTEQSFLQCAESTELPSSNCLN